MKKDTISKKIPLVEDLQFQGMSLGEIKKYIIAHFNANIRNTKMVNQHTGIRVTFSITGLKHLLHARNSGYVKLKAVMQLPEMIKYSIYTNFKNKDTDDGKDILGYFNFRVKVNVEANIHTFRIVVRLTKNGKFYYDHAVKVKK